MSVHDERLYHESDWAARRWDWFNDGPLVEPSSFCEFWRTVLLYASVKQLVSPVEVLAKALAPLIPKPSPPRPNMQPAVALARRAGSAVWSVLRLVGRYVVSIGRLSWFMARPVVAPVTSAAFNRAVDVGERVQGFSQRHDRALRAVSLVFLVGIALFAVTGFAVLVALESWFWSLIGVGIVVETALVTYWFFKSGVIGLIADVVGLLWEAAVVVKHGICPPVRIIRHG